MPLDPFRGPPQLTEIQRQLISAGLGAVPVVGPFLSGGYNAARGINALTKWIQGLQNSGGNYLPYANASGIPNANAAPGTFAGDPTNPNDPGNYALSGQQPSPSAGPAPSGGGYFGGATPGPGSSNTAWNSWRSPFSQTFQQATTPGSAIGPLSGQLSFDPRAAAGLGTSNPVISGIPGWAANATAEIYRKNQL